MVLPTPQPHPSNNRGNGISGTKDKYYFLGKTAPTGYVAGIGRG